ncbi:MAG TPA: YHS domain-containing protein [Methanoregula sp.]|nr:YHS domain-containing protein [Methanoregula sp.]
MAIDPVCYMVVDEENARFTSTYDNVRYYFCTDYCRKPR